MLLRECEHCIDVEIFEWMQRECGGVHTARGCENVLHKCRGSWPCLNIESLGTSFQKFIEPIHSR